MNIKEQIIKLADKYKQCKDIILTEETTKHALVVPFLKVLGYDASDPREVMPEFIADIGIKKGEKVDYAIIKDNLPIILIEVKWCGENLDNNGFTQLFRYFSTTKAQIAILTNGCEYRFYSDIDKNNILDNEPFFTFHINNFQHDDITILEHFSKNSFDTLNICLFAEQLKYVGKITHYLAEQFRNPSEEFTEFVMRNAFSKCNIETKKVKIRDTIKEALPHIINNIGAELLKKEEIIKITLNDDPKKVINHPLISFTFDGITYQQESYIQMLLDVINLLDKLKPGILETLISLENWPQSYRLSQNPSELHKPAKIKDNVFIEKWGISSSTVLKAIHKFFEKFNIPQSEFYILINSSIW